MDELTVCECCGEWSLHNLDKEVCTNCDHAGIQFAALWRMDLRKKYRNEPRKEAMIDVVTRDMAYG